MAWARVRKTSDGASHFTGYYLVIGVYAENRWVVIVAVALSGILIGINNTLVTTAVMIISPVPRPVASATYGFVRFFGGGLAPYAAGRLVERYNVHVPFVLGAVAVSVAAIVLSTVHQALVEADHEETHPGPSQQRHDAEQAIHDVPAVEEEAILADEAIREDHILNDGQPS